jgi:hypothetical protein
MRGSRRVVLVACTAVLAAAVLAGAGLARERSAATTGIPGTFAIINVKLGDKTLILSKHSSSGVQVIGFRIRNVGTVKHNFIIGTHATNAIAPGQFDDFAVAFDDFGKYTYRCTLNCPATSHGVIDVERGNYVEAGG